MVHTLEPILRQTSHFDQANFGLWVSLGIVVILIALYFRSKIQPKTFM